MNYTEKYHLPQWVETDRIMMEDFNQMCADIEAGLSDAKSTADTARMEAAEAAVLPYVVGSYTGNDAAAREIYVGFRPRFVLICSEQQTYTMDYAGRGLAMAGPNVHSNHIFMTDNGFRLELGGQNPHPKVNESGKAYDYMAFR